MTDLSIDTAALARFHLHALDLRRQLTELEAGLALTRATATSVIERSPAPRQTGGPLPLVIFPATRLAGSVLRSFAEQAPRLGWAIAQTSDRFVWVESQALTMALTPALGAHGAGGLARSAVNARSHLSNRVLIPVALQTLTAAVDPLIPSADNGDPGGRLTDRLTERFEVVGRQSRERGRAAIISGLADTVRKDLIRDDEFELVDHGGGHYTIVLPGVIDLSRPEAGLHDEHASVRDLQVAARSAASTSTTDNLYAVAVMDYCRRELPAGSTVAIVGHSFGADTALDLVADPSFNGEHVAVTHVVAAGYHSGPQLAALHRSEAGHDAAIDTEVLVLQNRLDLAVLVENLGHLATVSPSTDHPAAPAPDRGPIVRRFDGGWAGFGHHPSNYIDYLATAGSAGDDHDADPGIDSDVDQWSDPALEAFFTGWAEAGYAEAGIRRSVDISASN